MNITQKRNDGTDIPRYQHVKQEIKDYIVTHDLKPGDKVPTEAVLCSQLGYSRVTISRALNELQWEGLLERIQGSGTYIAKPKPKSVERGYRFIASSEIPRTAAPFFATLFAGIREAVAENEIDITYYQKANVPDLSEVTEANIDGVISIAWRSEDLASVIDLHNAGVHVVALASRNRAVPVPEVCTDNFKGIHDAVEYLNEVGHKRIAYLTSHLESVDVQERMLSFYQTVAKLGLPIDPSYFLGINQTQVSIVEQWLKGLSAPPTALLIGGELIGPTMSLLGRMGIRIPEDLSVIVIDDVNEARYFVPPLTVVRQPVYEMGYRGVTKLLNMIQGTDDGRPEILPTELIKRGSVAPPAVP